MQDLGKLVLNASLFVAGMYPAKTRLLAGDIQEVLVLYKGHCRSIQYSDDELTTQTGQALLDTIVLHLLDFKASIEDY